MPVSRHWFPDTKDGQPHRLLYSLVAKGLPARIVLPNAIPEGIVNAEVLYGEAPPEVEPLTLLYSTFGKKVHLFCMASINKSTPSLAAVLNALCFEYELIH